MWPYFEQPTPSGKPTITAMAADVGSAAGDSRSRVITGTNLWNPSSVQLGGVEHRSVATINSAGTQITLSSLLAGTAAAFSTVGVRCAGGSASWGNGTSFGFTYLPAGFVQWRADLGITFGSAPLVAAIANQGDVLPSNYNFTNATGGTQPSQVTGGSGINSLPALSFSRTGPQLLTLDTTMGSPGLSGIVWDGESYTVGTDDGIVRHMFTIQQCVLVANCDYHSFGFTNDNYFPLTSGGNVSDSQGSTFEATVGTGRWTDTTITSPHLYEVVTGWHNWKSWKNGTSKVAVSPSTTSALFNFHAGGIANPKLGNNQGNPTQGWGGLMAEMLWFRTQQTGSNRAVVVAYLYGRYGVTGT
jgi:hypothetical protein